MHAGVSAHFDTNLASSFFRNFRLHHSIGRTVVFDPQSSSRSTLNRRQRPARSFFFCSTSAIMIPTENNRCPGNCHEFPSPFPEKNNADAKAQVKRSPWKIGRQNERIPISVDPFPDPFPFKGPKQPTPLKFLSGSVQPSRQGSTPTQTVPALLLWRWDRLLK